MEKSESPLPKKHRRPGLGSEILHFFKVYKKWWLFPMVVVFIFFAILITIAEVAPIISPFIYTLF